MWAGVPCSKVPQMINRCMNKCLTLLILRKIWIITILLVSAVLTEFYARHEGKMLMKLRINGKNCTLLVGTWINTASWKIMWRYLKSQQLKWLYDPRIPLVLHAKEFELLVWQDLCTPIFTTVKIWQQLKRSSVDEWIKKMWFIGTMGSETLFENQKFFHWRWQGWTKRAAFHGKTKFWWSMAQSGNHKLARSDLFKCPHHKVIYKYVRWQASSVALFKRYIKMRHYPMYITIVN